MKLAASIVATALAAPAMAGAKIVDLAFPADGRFADAEASPAGKFVEVCGKFEQGQRVDWSFQAAAPLDFNIHYHVGDKVEFPEKRSAIGSLEGAFVAPVAQHYCWMWKNTGKSDVKVATSFAKR